MLYHIMNTISLYIISEYNTLCHIITYRIICYLPREEAWPYHTIPYHTTPHYTILHYTILHYTILYYTIMYYTILAFRHVVLRQLAAGAFRRGFGRGGRGKARGSFLVLLIYMFGFFLGFSCFISLLVCCVVVRIFLCIIVSRGRVDVCRTRCVAAETQYMGSTTHGRRAVIPYNAKSLIR